VHDLNFEMFQGVSTLPLMDGEQVRVSPERQYTDVILKATTPEGKRVERRYRFFPGRYDFEASIKYPQEHFPDAHQVSWGLGPGMMSTEKNVKDDQMNFKASVLLGEEYHRKKPGDFGDKSAENYEGTLNWVSVQTKYFTTALIPMEPSRAWVTVFGDKVGHRVSATATMPVGPGRGEVEQTVRVYMGPLEMDIVKALNVGLDRNVELGMRFIRPVSTAILWSMVKLYKVIPNYGWVIIIISVLSKVLFFRLTHKSFKSMKEMQDLAPTLAAIKEKYKDDRQKVSEQTMKTYKEAGVNPLGGCLPMLLQMPVFIALFNVLKHTIGLRNAEWFGWITDLSQQDVLFALPFSIPVIGEAFSVLPLLMGAAMFAQSKLGGSPTGSPGGAMPAGMTTIMPIAFTFMFYKMPSGLVLYWLINTVLSAAQQIYINRGNKPAEPEDRSNDKKTLKSNER